MNKVKLIILLTFVFGVSLVFAQTSVWSEDFTYNDGITQGSGTPARWTTAGGTLDSGDHFEVRNNMFECVDLDSEATWTTELISIAGLSNLEVSFDCQETGDHEASDHVDLYISIDGGAFTVVPNFTFESTNYGTDDHTIIGDVPDDSDWGSLVITADVATGSTVQFKLTVFNNSGTEVIRIDNFLLVSGAVGDTTPPTVSTVIAVNVNSVTVLFDETVNALTAMNTANYTVDTIGMVIEEAVVSVGDDKLIELIVTGMTEATHTLTVANVTDVAGNVMVSQDIDFTYTAPTVYANVDVEDFESCPTSGGDWATDYLRADTSIGWSMTDVSGSKNWQIKDFSGAKYAECSGYSGVGSCDDWLILGPIDFSTFENETFSFDSKSGYQNAAGSEFFPNVLISNDYTPASRATWNEVSGVTWCPHTGSGYGTWTASGDIDLSQTIGGTDYTNETAVYIAIRYNAVSAETTTWQIDNLVVKGTSASSDTTAPSLVSAEATDATNVLVTFDEDVDLTTAEALANYALGTRLVEIVSATRNATNYAQVNLSVAGMAAASYTLLVENVEDIAGNAMSLDSTTFSYSGPADTTPPTLSSIDVVDANNIMLTFDEEVDATTANDYASNYLIDMPVREAVITGAARDAVDFTKVNLSVTGLVYGDYMLAIENIEDLFGNPMSYTETSFSYVEPIVVYEKELEDFENCISTTNNWTNDYVAGNQSGGWSTYSVSGSNDFNIKTNNGEYYAEISGYGSTGNCDDWLISPAVDFSQFTGDKLTFDSNSGYQNDDFFLTLLISNDYTSGDPTLATWNEITSATWCAHTGSGYGDWTASGDLDLSVLIGGVDYSDAASVHIAMRYNATAGQTTTWQIDNLTVWGSGVPDPEIFVTIPNGTESWEQNTTHGIVWDNVQFSGNVDILLTDNDVAYSTLASDVANTGSWTWDVGTTPASTTYKVVVKANGFATPTDTSDAFFSIYASVVLEDDVFISEYIEGSSNNKALELYNPTALAVDLQNYRLVSSQNGSGLKLTDPLYIHGWDTENILAPGGLWVIANSSYSTSVFDQTKIDETAGYTTDRIASFNGDDAVALQRNFAGVWVTIDLIGDPDNDPGSSWPVGTGTTANYTLMRKTTITMGNPGVLASFDPSEWDVEDQNFSNLGYFGIAGDTDAPEVLSVSVTSSTSLEVLFNEKVTSITANNRDNYWITGDASIMVNGASLETVDSLLVTLTVGTMTAGDYVLHTRYIADTLGNTIVEVTNNFTYVELPDPASIVITEIMQNPSALSDSYGEWFEIYNAGATSVNLNGWTLSDNGSDSHTVADSSLVIAAGAYLVFATNADSMAAYGVTAAYDYGSFTLSNSDDEVIISDTYGRQIDIVTYTGGGDWVDPAGASMMYTGEMSADNNVGLSWITAPAVWTNSGGDMGTPGAENAVGPTELDTPLDIEISIVGANVQLTWTAVTSANSYIIHKSATDDFGTYETLTSSDTTYQDALTESGMNFYRVLATDTMLSR